MTHLWPTKQTLVILYASVTGTAELVADTLADHARAAGFNVDLLSMADATPEILREDACFIICSASYGQGEVPDTGKQFVEKIESARPDLGGLHYGMLALGDRNYADTFLGGGKQIDALLSALGARRLGERFEHDSSSGLAADEEALSWFKPWLEAHAGACVAKAA